MRAELTATDLEIEGLPRGGGTDVAQIVVHMSGAFPTDSSVGRLRETEELRMEVRMHVIRPDGTTAEVEIRSLDEESTELTR
ncbi:MAG: hypothetical protein R3B82_13555 [Sandaracinaceae bacterium]